MSPLRPGTESGTLHDAIGARLASWCRNVLWMHKLFWA